MTVVPTSVVNDFDVILSRQDKRTPYCLWCRLERLIDGTLSLEGNFIFVMLIGISRRYINKVRLIIARTE